MQKFLSVIFAVICISFCASFAKAQKSAVSRFAEIVDSLHRDIVFPYTVVQGITVRM